jgi:hypothetical protein
MTMKNFGLWLSVQGKWVVLNFIFVLVNTYWNGAFWYLNTLVTEFEILNLFSDAVLQFIYFDEKGEQLI